MWPIFARGELKAIVSDTLPLAEAADAHRLMERAVHSGKIVLQVCEDSERGMATIDVKTDITGSVWKVLKRAGDPVAEDEPILVLESMKMEIPITSPEPGVIKEILVKEGEIVSDGAVVVRIDV